MKFSIKDFFSKCDQIRSFLQISSHLLKKSLLENFSFCAAIGKLESILVSDIMRISVLSWIFFLRNSSLFLKEVTFKCAMIGSYKFFLQGAFRSGSQPHHHRYWDMILLLQNYLGYWKTHHCHFENLLWVENILISAINFFFFS